MRRSPEHESLRVKSIPALPEGFNLLYSCKNHPERVVVAPIACRQCEECHNEALHNYAAYMVKHDQRERMEGREFHGYHRYEDNTETHLRPKREPKKGML